MSAGAMFAMTAVSAVTDIMAGSAAKKQADINAMLYEQQGAFYEQRGDLNARLYEQQAGFIDILKGLESERIDIGMGIDLTQQLRAKSKLASTLMASTAGAGLEYSGSPVAVMLDNLTQAGIDEEITKYNYTMDKITSEYAREQEKIQALAEAGEARMGGRLANINLRGQAATLRYKGKIARATGYSSALSTMLKGGYQYGVRTGKIKVSSGADEAGRL